jgi:hypothetical protein
MTDVKASTPAVRDLTVPLLGVACIGAAAAFPLKINKMLGLPAHVLFLHVPVVLVPIVCILITAMAVRPAWRAKWGLATALLATGTMIATELTVGAGEAFRDQRGESGAKLSQHAELGEQTRLLIIVLAIAFILLLVADQQLTLPAALAPVIAIAFTALAILTIVWVARTGHLGAELAYGGS